tara:strand:+ start:347 stop:505 length:159 start_codon:yes stop_codon:yes gene_type:complete
MVQASQKRAAEQLADFLTLLSAMKSQHISATQADVPSPNTGILMMAMAVRLN